MTLTTERLKWLHDAATELSATKLKMTMRPDELLVLTSELLANREAQPVPANAQIAGYFVRQRPEWDKRAPWTSWKEVDAASYDDIVKIIATGEAYCGWFYDNRILYTAQPAPAVPDEIDSFADQVIGTKDKIIHLPAPMPVPLEGIRVYLNADAVISFLEKQGYIVEVSRE